MRPPECAVCGDEFDSTGGRLVSFAERDSDRQWRLDAAVSHAVGHPPNVDWFCAKHSDAAAALAGSTIDVALRELTETSASSQVPAPTRAPEIVRVPIPARDINDLLRMFRERMSRLAGDPTAVSTTTTERTWSPMDGSKPPDCPFEDVDTTTVVGPLGEIQLTWDRAMYNPDDAARRTARLVVETRGGAGPSAGARCSVSATVGAGFSGSVGSAATELLVLGTPSPELQELIDELVG